MSNWHIRQGDETKGPFSDEQLKALCEAGVLNASSLAWNSDYPHWKPLAETNFIYKSVLAPPPFKPENQGSRPASSAENLSLWGFFTRAIGEKYAAFTGRASRKEYWSVVLFNTLFLILIAFLGAMLDGIAGNLGQPEPRPVMTSILIIVYALGVALPGLALYVRRLHDIGLSGWLVLVGGVPYIGGIFVLVTALIPSQREPNKHGLSLNSAA